MKDYFLFWFNLFTLTIRCLIHGLCTYCQFLERNLYIIWWIIKPGLQQIQRWFLRIWVTIQHVIKEETPQPWLWFLQLCHSVFCSVLSCVYPWDPLDCSPQVHGIGSSVHRDVLGKNGVGCHFLPRGSSWPDGLHLTRTYCKQIPLPTGHQWKPCIINVKYCLYFNFQW